MQLNVKNAQVNLIEKGAGPPTLLLHGNPDNGAMWEGVMARLSSQYRCLAPDLPGYGRSTAPDNFDLSLQGRADFIEALVTALGITEPLNLVMHDFGGHFGLAWAVKHPAKVRRLAISNTNFFSDYQWHLFGRLTRMPIVGELMLATMTWPTFRPTIKSASPTLSDALIRRMYEGYTPSAKQMALKLYRASDSSIFKGWEDEYRALTKRVSTIVLWGDRDPFVTPAWAERFGAKETHHFPQYGHWLPLEAPDEFAERLLAFFA
jgi:pimeloyl-ACP methyl ester carboxylesterase